MIDCESYFRFTLPDGSRHYEEVDQTDRGVDFEIAGDPPVWMEVKNWESPPIPERLRDQKRQEFALPVSTDEFWDGMTRKFEGTHDCLVKLGERPESPVLLILMECAAFERGDVAVFTSILEEKVATSEKVRDGKAAVGRFADLSVYVPGTRADPCSFPNPDLYDCAEPLLHCSAQKRGHRQAAGIWPVD